MHCFLHKVAILSVGYLIIPVALAVPSQTSSASPSLTATASASESDEGIKCDNLYYPYLPGMVDYCAGMRDWRSGKYRNGLERFKLAAGWGSKRAQYSLGMIYYNGNHVRRDRALGIAWLKLANERHDDAQTDRVLRSAMTWATDEQRQRADKLFKQMRKRYGDKVATVRAWRQLARRKKYVANESMSMNVPLCFVPSGGGGQSQALSGNTGAQVEGTIMGEHTDPSGRQGTSSSGVYSGSCVTSQDLKKTLSHLVSVYFHGWMGTVTVEPLQPVPASSVH